MLVTAQPAAAPHAGTELDLYHDVLDDITAYLDADGLPDVACRSAIRSMIRDRVPRRPRSMDTAAGRLWPGATPDDAARMIAHILAWNRGPATAALAGLAGTGPAGTAISTTWARAGRVPEPADLDLLGASPGDVLYGRDGTLSAGGVTLAATRLLLVAGRVPPEALTRIQAGEPAGAALAPYGMTRGARHARAYPGEDPAVAASAVLWIGRTRIGLAAEQIPRGLCEHLAVAAGVSPPASA